MARGDHLLQHHLGERLGQPRHVEGAAFGQFGIAGGDDYRQLRPLGTEPLGEFEAGHLRHRLIGHDEVDRAMLA